MDLGQQREPRGVVDLRRERACRAPRRGPAASGRIRAVALEDDLGHVEVGAGAGIGQVASTGWCLAGRCRRGSGRSRVGLEAGLVVGHQRADLGARQRAGEVAHHPARRQDLRRRLVDVVQQEPPLADA